MSPERSVTYVSGTDMKRLAPQVGLEPTTLRLTAGCSAIELLRSRQQARPRKGQAQLNFSFTITWNRTRQQSPIALQPPTVRDIDWLARRLRPPSKTWIAFPFQRSIRGSKDCGQSSFLSQTAFW